GENLHPLLHHQADRRGDRPGALPFLRHRRPAARRRAARRDTGGRVHRVHHRAAAVERKAGRRMMEAIADNSTPVRLLVVDDEPDLELLIRQKFRRQIRENQVHVLFARNGVEALEVLQRDPKIDIVLTDINMPDMDGLTLLLRLNEMDLLIKAVIVSAYGAMENIRVAMTAGAADSLTKPIDFQDLEITIRTTLQQLLEARRAISVHEQLVAIQRELSVASNIQQSILPRVFPPF